MNIGGIFRLLSTENDEKTDTVATPVNPESKTGLNTFFSTPGKLIDSVNTKTGHFVSDLGSKLSNLKQVSVEKFEHAVRNTGVGMSTSVSKERGPDPVYETGSEEPVESRVTTPLQSAPRTLRDNPFNVSSKQGGSVESETAGPVEWTTTVGSRRRSSTNLPRPPRPPPPVASALNRAISLDEGSGKAKLPPKYQVKPLQRLGTTVEQEDEQRESRSVGKKGFGEEGESSASEYGADGDQPVYMSEKEDSCLIEGKRVEGQANNETEDVRKFQNILNKCIPLLLSGRLLEHHHLDETLSEMLTDEVGRMSFVSALEREAKRNDGQLENTAIPDLLKKIDVLLSECQDAEDFKPAKKLLTTSLLFQATDPCNPDQKVPLFVRIKHLPIWQSLRFWNACFFQSVQEARVRSGEQGNTTDSAEKIAYEQLHLHQSIMQEFLRKHGTLFNLTDGEINSLQASINSVT